MGEMDVVNGLTINDFGVGGNPCSGLFKNPSPLKSLSIFFSLQRGLLNFPKEASWGGFEIFLLLCLHFFSLGKNL